MPQKAPETTRFAAPQHINADLAPAEQGFYFATNRRAGWRSMLLIAPDGNKHVRAHVPRMGRSFGLEEFTGYTGPIVEE